MIEEVSAMQSRIADEAYDREVRLTFRLAIPVYQPTLADQLKSLATRLHGLNSFDRTRLSDIIAAMRRKEAALETYSNQST